MNKELKKSSSLTSVFRFVDEYAIFVVIGFFLLAYLGKSLLLHWSFLSHSWDLGIFAQQTWLYSHTISLFNTVRGTNLLSDHFGIILYLFALFYRLFPRAETILVIQAVLVCASAYPIFYLSKKYLKNGWVGAVIATAYLSSSGIRQAIDFDFHLATVAVFFFSYFLLFYLNKKNTWAIIFAILAMLCKEDVPLYIAFASLGLIILNIKNKKEALRALLFFVGSVVVFFIITKVMSLIPATGGNFNYFSFNYLGKSYGDVLKNTLSQPVEIVRLVWENFVNNETKITTFKTYFTGFWYLPFLSPETMVASIPFLLTKFVSDRSSQWGLNGQYAVTGMFLLSVGTLQAVYRLSKIFRQQWRTAILVGWSLLFLLFTLYYNFSGENRNYWNMFDKANWQATKQYRGLDALIKKVPQDASVASQDKIIPHLASRREVYMFYCQYCQIPADKVFDYLILTDRYGFELAPEGKADSRPIIEELLSRGSFDGKGKYILFEKANDGENTYYLFKNSD